MKAIHANPRKIREIFQEKYIIPEYQRPYSWETDQCEKLWDDIIEFTGGLASASNDDSDSDKYFLGNIIVHPGDKGSLVVIDGQQRITSLQLLIKALHSKAGTVLALEECLKIKNPLTNILTDDLRVQSHVVTRIGDNDRVDSEKLKAIIFDKSSDLRDDDRFKRNYRRFEGLIEKWWSERNSSADELNKLILTILDEIVILPINCDTQDDALTVFQTINDRGLPLSDADIFKAKLYRSARDEGHEEEFTSRWGQLQDHETLFRVHMHVDRSIHGDSSKEKALRSYFADPATLKDWKSILLSLEKYSLISDWNSPPEVYVWWEVLETFPNLYWKYPLYVFLHKYGEVDDNGFALNERYHDQLIQLMRGCIRFFFVKGVVHNSVNAVKDQSFKLCVKIQREEPTFWKDLNDSAKSDIDSFLNRLNGPEYGRYTKGLVLINAFLEEIDNPKRFLHALLEGKKIHIEHILPKQWNNYDQWDEGEYIAQLNTLGNLVPLEWKLNISAKDSFFKRKQEKYSQSGFKAAKNLTRVSDWSAEACRRRHKEVVDRMRVFVDGE